MGSLEYNVAEPWARQPCDTDLSWALFQQYLTQAVPRRLADLAGRPLGLRQLTALAESDGWDIRARCWDRHLDRLRQQTIEQVTKEDARARAERQAQLAKDLQTLAKLEVTKLVQVYLRNPEGPHGVIRPMDAIRAAAIGIRMERLALGETTDKIDAGPDLSKLSLEDLRQLSELQDKIKSGDQG